MDEMQDIKVRQSKVLIQGFDVLDMVSYIGRLTKRYQANLLTNLEYIVRDEKDFSRVRKLILDSTNNFSRAIVKTIFGDFEE